MKLIRLTESDLHNIIRESVRRVIEEAEEIFITVNGVPMTKKQWLKYKKEKEKKMGIVPPKKPKKEEEGMGEEQASPRALAVNVKKLVTDTSLISIKGFINNGERQFGPNAIRMLVNLFEKEAGQNLFVRYNMIYTGITETISEIENWGKRNEHAVYDRALKLANLLRDLVDILNELSNTYKTLSDGDKFNKAFGKNANVIMGNGHSLGLRSLIFAKSAKVFSRVTSSLLMNANKLEAISENGRDPFDYDPNHPGRRG